MKQIEVRIKPSIFNVDTHSTPDKLMLEIKDICENIEDNETGCYSCVTPTALIAFEVYCKINNIELSVFLKGEKVKNINEAYCFLSQPFLELDALRTKLILGDNCSVEEDL